MPRCCAIGIGAIALVSALGAPGQEASWTPLQLSSTDADRGVLSDVFVVKEQVVPGQLAGRGIVDSLVTGAEGGLEHRLVAQGKVIDGHRYRLIRVVDSDLMPAVHSLGDSAAGLSIERVVVGQATASRTDGLPNDPLLVNQYAIENNGQTVDGQPGVPGADVRVGAAWTLQRGSAQVRIAVIDSGVSATHPDLRTKLDGGVNITGGPTDDTDAPFNTHGTHIAGIVGASTNNNEGVVGVSWGSRIVPVKAANPLGFTSDVWLAEGLIWAADQGVDVAVLSFGLSGPSDVLADAVRYAYDRGVVVCGSAGNLGSEGVLYPAAYPEVIAVGATTNTDAIANFSNFGPELELVAPGVDIFSTKHTTFDPHTYGFESGTSVSTPIVAGVAALLRSADPEITVEEIRSVLARTSRDLGTAGRDGHYGFGRVNAYRALQEVIGVAWCYADVDGDGVVQPVDFSAWIGLYAANDLRADQNRDGLLEPSDLNAFILNYSRQVGHCND